MTNKEKGLKEEIEKAELIFPRAMIEDSKQRQFINSVNLIKLKAELKGFQEGKTQTLEKVKEKIEKLKEIIELIGNTDIHESLERLDFVYIRKVDLDKIRNKHKELLSSLEDLDVPEEKE